MRMLKALVIAGGLLLCGNALAKDMPVDAKGEARLAKLLEGRVAGQPVNCVQLNLLRDSEVIDHTAIVYHGPGNTLYVNRPDSGASGLDWNSILVTRTSISQLCQIDIVRLIDRGSFFPRGFVGLGQFVPYTKPKAH